MTKSTPRRSLSPSRTKTVAPKPAAKARSAPKEPAVTAKQPTKADQLMLMVMKPGGALLDDVAKAMGIQPHSARAVISVHSRKRGLEVSVEKGRYRVAG